MGMENNVPEDVEGMQIFRSTSFVLFCFLRVKRGNGKFHRPSGPKLKARVRIGYLITLVSIVSPTFQQSRAQHLRLMSDSLTQ